MYYEESWEIKESFFGLEHMEMQASKLLEEKLKINPYEVDEWVIIHPPTDFDWNNHDNIKYLFVNLKSTKSSGIDMRIYFKRIIRDLEARFKEYSDIQNNSDSIYFRSYPNEKVLEIYFLPLDSNLSDLTEYSDDKSKTRKYEYESKIRNRKLVNELKNIHEFRCQICGQRISKGSEPIEFYCEVHHLKTLSENSDENLDVIGNLIVVCPNHHIEFQYNAIAIDPEDEETIIHIMGDENPYHGESLKGMKIHNIDHKYNVHHYRRFIGEND